MLRQVNFFRHFMRKTKTENMRQGRQRLSFLDWLKQCLKKQAWHLAGLSCYSNCLCMSVLDTALIQKKKKQKFCLVDFFDKITKSSRQDFCNITRGKAMTKWRMNRFLREKTTKCWAFRIWILQSLSLWQNSSSCTVVKEENSNERKPIIQWT